MKDSTDKRIEIASELEKYDDNFKDNYPCIKKLWKDFFDISLKDMGIEEQKSIDVLFWEWDMKNWDAMHRENTVYKTSSREHVYSNFSGEASYIADRISLDRLFRTHWLYRQVFYDEISEDLYPESTTFKGFIKHWK